MRKKKESENYLDFIPVRNPNFEFRTNDTGIVTVLVEWTGFYHRIAQRFFHRPRVSEINLDEYGSFIWQQIDGEKNVFAISQAFQSHFDNPQNGMTRLIQFLEIMRDHHLIFWKGESKHT